MKKFTTKHFGEKGSYMICSEQFGCDGNCGDCQNLDTLVQQLAAYEETGLSPDDVRAQQTRITELEAELEEERYRHDRVQDFEVAEAQELARVKGQLDEAIRELRHLSACSTCSKNGSVCHVGMPVAEGVVCCGGYRWRGAKDTNVPGKPVTDTNVGGKEAT